MDNSILDSLTVKGIARDTNKPVTGLFAGIADAHTAFIQCVRKTGDALEILGTYSVYADTLCRYTCMRDRNRQKIFEHDRVSSPEHGLSNAEIIWLEGKKRWAAQPDIGSRYLISHPEQYLYLEKTPKTAARGQNPRKEPCAG